MRAALDRPVIPAAPAPTRGAADLRVAGAAAAVMVVAGPALEFGTLCPLKAATGLPCPLCGLTTGVAAAAHGDLLGSLQAHPLALMALAVLLAAWTPLGPAVADGLRRHPAAVAAALAVVWVARLAGLVGS